MGVRIQVTDEQYNLIKSNFYNDKVGHHGEDATVEKMKEKGYTPVNFPQMRQVVMSFIHSCAFCEKQDQRKQPVAYFVIGPHKGGKEGVQGEEWVDPVSRLDLQHPCVWISSS